MSCSTKGWGFASSATKGVDRVVGEAMAAAATAEAASMILQRQLLRELHRSVPLDGLVGEAVLSYTA